MRHPLGDHDDAAITTTARSAAKQRRLAPELPRPSTTPTSA